MVTYGFLGFGIGPVIATCGVLAIGSAHHLDTARITEVLGITRLVGVGTTLAVIGVKFISLN